jgi:hypothetical protein
VARAKSKIDNVDKIDLASLQPLASRPAYECGRMIGQLFDIWVRAVPQGFLNIVAA